MRLQKPRHSQAIPASCPSPAWIFSTIVGSLFQPSTLRWRVERAAQSFTSIRGCSEAVKLEATGAVEDDWDGDGNSPTFCYMLIDQLIDW